MDVCDFCSSTQPTWDYPARDFVVQPLTDRLRAEGKPGAGSEGDWAACDTCHALIETGDREALALRAATKFASQYGVPVRTLLAPLRQLHDQFWSSRKGKPTPIHTNQEA